VTGEADDQGAFRVARDDEVPSAVVALEQRVDHGPALRAVAGAREGDHEIRTFGRKAAVGMGEQGPCRDRLNGHAEGFLEREGQAFGRVDGAAGAGQDDRAAMAIDSRGGEDSPQLVGLGREDLRGLEPGHGLLSDLPQGMLVDLSCAKEMLLTHCALIGGSVFVEIRCCHAEG
jgi:hypothetical protein